jgi:hypothetical protein
MIGKRALALAMSVAVAGGVALAGAAKKPDPKEPAERGGTVIGVLVAKGENFIEVKADGEEKARRYVPQWVGGTPAQGGGFDKEMLAKFRTLKLGSRVRLEWKFEERPRVVKIEVLKAPAEQPDEAKKPAKDEEKRGTVVGVLVAKGNNFIEVKADGEEKPRRYVLHMGGTKELLRAMKETPIGSRVKVEWLFLERLRVLRLEVLKAPEKDQ